MFWSSTIIRKLALNLSKVILTLKHSVKLRLIYYAVVWQHVMEWRVLCAVQNVTRVAFCTAHKHMPFYGMLPHNHIINNDVISPNVLT